MYKLTVGEKIFALLNIVVLTALALTTLYPFWYTLVMSLSNTVDSNQSGLHLFTKHISFVSYKMVFRNHEIYTGYINTIFRTAASVILSLLVTSMFAYPLSKSYMPNKRLYTVLLIFTMLFNGGIIPTYLLIKQIGLIDNRWVLVLPGLLGAFNVIIVKNYFMSLPESLAESARIDGANEFRILFGIIIPLSKPVLATLTLWIAASSWNSWFDALIYINSDTKQVLQIFLQRILVENNSDIVSEGLVNPDLTQFTPETIKAATIIVTILPILCVYPFIQKYFVKGVMLGAVKG